LWGGVVVAIEALKKSNISNYSINEKQKTVSIIDVKDFADAKLKSKTGSFVKELKKKN